MPFFSEGTQNSETDPLLKVLMKVLIAMRTLATNLYPSINLSSPSFYSEGSTPVSTDPKYKVAQKILGVLNDLNNAISGATPAGCATFIRRRFGAGSPEGVVTACRGDTYWDTTNDLLYVKDVGDNTNTGWK